MPLEAAAPEFESALAAVPEVTTQPEYVYLSRFVEEMGAFPKAIIPIVEFPDADW